MTTSSSEPPRATRRLTSSPQIIAEVRNMVLNKAFITAPNAPRPPRAKVALGAKKATAARISSDPLVIDVSAPTPTDTPSGSAAEFDLQMTHGQSRQEPEVEEVLPLKCTKRSASGRSSELPCPKSPKLREGLCEKDTLAAALVDRIRDKVPGMETIMEWSYERHMEQIAEDILRLTHTTTDLFCRARALENIQEMEVGPLQKQVKIKELEKELAAAERRAKEAEKAEKEAMEKMKDASSLARFICSDEAITKEFLTAFVNIEVEDKLVWVYGQWSFTTGCRAMQEQVHTALTEGLEETDLPEVLALLPDEVADPGPKIHRPRNDQPVKKKIL
nr:leucine zipper putative tumor suppressor 2-like [Ipomoea batatas]